MEEKEIVVFLDENGNDVEMEVLAYVEYNGKEYAALTDVMEGADEEIDEEVEVMFAEVAELQGEEEELDFIPVEDEALVDALFEILMREDEE